jgi:hypothetical protein
MVAPLTGAVSSLTFTVGFGFSEACAARPGISCVRQSVFPDVPLTLTTGLDLAGQADRLERVRCPPAREQRLDHDRRRAVGGVAQPRCPEVLPLRPDDPELRAVGLDCERELIRRAARRDRDLAPHLPRSQSGDRHVLRARPGHEGVPTAVRDERHSVGSGQRLCIRACGKIHGAAVAPPVASRASYMYPDLPVAFDQNAS